MRIKHNIYDGNMGNIFVVIVFYDDDDDDDDDDDEDDIWRQVDVLP